MGAPSIEVRADGRTVDGTLSGWTHWCSPRTTTCPWSSRSGPVAVRRRRRHPKHHPSSSADFADTPDDPDTDWVDAWRSAELAITPTAVDPLGWDFVEIVRVGVGDDADRYVGVVGPLSDASTQDLLVNIVAEQVGPRPLEFECFTATLLGGHGDSATSPPVCVDADLVEHLGDTGSPDEAASDADASDNQGGCGCSAGSAASAHGLLLTSLSLLGRRRRSARSTTPR